jgi:ABC-type transport system involved in cytochrome bd biosynthesis fused ATPase/permease subunit
MNALRLLVSSLRPGVRAGLAALAVAQSAMRVAMAFALEGLVREGARALVLGVATGAVWAVISAARIALRNRVRVALLRGSASALLHGEVSDAPREGETPHAVLAAVFDAEKVLADALPMACGEGLAALVLGAVAIARVPPLFVAALAGAAAVTLALLVVVRRALAHAQEQANLAQRRLFARWLEAKDGALEIAAAALEERHVARVDEAAEEWLRATARVELGSALLGRGPMAALALALGALAWLELGQGPNGLALTAFLAASAAPLAGLASALSELGRSLGRAEPLVHRLASPARARAAHLEGDPTDALAAEDLAAGYEGRAVLDRLAIRWERGTPLVAEGPNGAGKTTLLRVLAGLRTATGGRLVWEGERASSSSPPSSSARVPVAFLPQRAHLAQESTVADALRMLAPDATEVQMRSALARAGLAHRLRERGLETLVGTLSVGQRQRLAIARALLVEAPIVVLDEPDANLDREGRARIDAIVGELARDRFVALVAHGDLARPPGAAVITLGRAQSEEAPAAPSGSPPKDEGVSGA